jgi:hypothetical protein
VQHDDRRPPARLFGAREVAEQWWRLAGRLGLAGGAVRRDLDQLVGARRRTGCEEQQKRHAFGEPLADRRGTDHFFWQPHRR